jgi:hypothetical protein
VRGQTNGREDGAFYRQATWGGRAQPIEPTITGGQWRTMLQAVGQERVLMLVELDSKRRARQVTRGGQPTCDVHAALSRCDVTEIPSDSMRSHHEQ